MLMRPRRQLGRVWRSPMFIIGASMMVVGAVPLLSVIILSELGLTSDPNPNPIGFGLLFTFLFWPGIVLVLVAFGRFAGPPRQ